MDDEDGWSLAGRVFAVLGVGPGIGLETARALGRAGALVACVDIDRARAEAAAADVSGFAIVADVLSAGGFDRTMDELEAKGRGPLRGVVDVVGGSLGSSLVDAHEDLIDRNFELNLRHAFRVIRRAGPMMGAAGGGALVFVGSLAGVVSSPSQAIYGSAKAALHHLVRCAGVELGPHGVRVNAVAPGLVATPRMLERFTTEEFDQMQEASPLRRIVQPSDVARVIAFLSCDMSGAITSQTLVVDGGFSAQPRMFAP